MRIRSTVACLAAFATTAIAATAEAAEAPDFRPAVRISPALPHPSYSDPDVEVRDGRSVAVWTKTRTGTQSWIQAADLGANGRPGPVTTIPASPDSGWDNDPAVALSDAGTAAVVWEGSLVVPPPVARLSVLDPGLAPGPTQSLGEGYDPAVRYPATGEGLTAWSGAGELSIAPIDPSGTIGDESAIPLDDGTRAFDPTIELAPDGGRIYWTSAAGVLEARVSSQGEPESVTTILPPPYYAYRDLTVSGQTLVTLLEGRRHVDLICVPLAGGSPKTIDSGRTSDQGPIRIGSADVDTVGSHGLIGWVRHRRDGGRWVAKAATVDDTCRVTRTVSLPSPGRRAYDTQVGHDGSSPLALVAGGGGLESVGLSRSGKVRASRRVARTKPLSQRIKTRTPVNGLELVTEPGSRPTAVWAQTHRGPGRTIAASVAR